MARIRPVPAAAAVLLFGAAILAADYAIDGGFSSSGYRRVAPENGQVVLDVSDLESGDVRYYRFLNTGNQEVKFFVGRDPQGDVLAAFDANEICYKTQRGYRHEGGWVACNKCDKAFELAEINGGGGGCKPVPLKHTLAGNRLVLAESSILEGWRYFR